MPVERLRQREIVVSESARRFFLDSFRDAWREHESPGNPDSTEEHERRAVARASVDIWTNVLTNLEMDREMERIKFEEAGHTIKF